MHCAGLICALKKNKKRAEHNLLPLVTRINGKAVMMSSAPESRDSGGGSL